MDEHEIRTNYSTRIQWHSILEPHLLKKDLHFKDILCISELIPYKEYIAFLKVQALTNTKGIWFTNWVKVRVYFKEDVYLTLEPVHFRKEILQWKEGSILVDNRDRI